RDIIIFKCPLEHRHLLIKRIIALPGETVEICDGQVYINNQWLHESYTLRSSTYSWGPGVVPPGQLFVLADNRNSLSDSHAWGWLPTQNVIGKVWFVWPPSAEYQFRLFRSGREDSSRG